MVDPIPPPSTPIPPPSSPSPVPLVFSPTGPSDTFSVFTLPDGQSVGFRADIPILTFAKEVSTPLSDAKENLWAVQQANFIRLNQTFNAMISNAIAGGNISLAVSELSQNADSVYTSNQDNVNNLNASATSYNSSQSTMATDATAVNNASAAYNAIGGNTLTNLATLNAAIATYNTDAANYNTARSSYNTAASDFNTATETTPGGGSGSTNDTLNIIHSDAVSLQVSSSLPYAQQTLATPISSGPLSTLAAAPPAPGTVTAPPTASTLTNNIPTSYTAAISVLAPVITLLDAFATVFQNFGIALKSQNKYLNYVQYFLQGQNPTIPAAYITPIPSIFIGTGSSGGGAATGSGAALTTLILTLSNPNVSTIVGNSNESADAQAQILRGIAFLTSSFLFHLQFLGLNAARLTDEQLKVTQLATKDPNSPAVSALLGINLAQFIAQFASSKQLPKFIQQYIQETLSQLSPAQQTQLAETLTNNARLYFTSASLTTLAQSLGLPNLPNQLLNSVTDNLGITNPNQPSATSTTTGTAGTAPQTSLEDVLNNPYSVAQLKVYLSNQGGGAAQQANVQTSVNQAINSGPFNAPGVTPEQQFGTTVTNQFIQIGVPQATATQNGQTATAFVQGEAVLGPGLEASAAHTDDLKGSLLNGLSGSGLPAGVTNNAVNSTTQSLSSQDDFSVRQVRDRLALNLQKSDPNLTPAAALAYANQAVAGLTNLPAQNTTDLETTVATQFTSHGPTKHLARVLDTLLTTPPTIGTNPAKTIPSLTTSELYNQIHTLLFGNSIDSANPSLSALLRDYLSIVSKDPNSLAAQQALATLRQSLSPTYSLFEFNNSIKDPANTLIFTSQVSPMYAKPAKGTYKESTDVILG